MFHPCVIATFNAYRIGQQLNALDACTDTADYHDLSVYRVAQFLITTGVAIGIDADRLSLLS